MSEPAPTADELKQALEKLPIQLQSLFAADLLNGNVKPGYKIPGDPVDREFIRRPKCLKFDSTEREAAKLAAAKMERMGYNELQIAEKLGVEKHTARKLLEETRAQYNEQIMAVRSELAMRELAVLLDVRQEAYEGLERAKQGLRTYIHKQVIGGKDGNTFEDHQEEREVLPPGEYMRIILQTNERICDMFGLDQAVKQIINVSTTNNNVVLTGEALLQTILANRQARDQDPVKRRLAEVEAVGRPSIMYTSNGVHRADDDLAP